jgi:23S rRNA pseudouridine2605 synthase
MRLNAYLSKTGVSSRRGADVLVKAGRVTVNGQKGQLNSQVTEVDDIRLDNQPLKLRKSRYILLNKPAKYVTTLKDPQNRQKVVDLVDISERVVPVGRLDFGTTGVLLLTNDGELAHKLMHPSFGVDKVYEAEISGQITDKILKQLRAGVVLEEGKTAPAKARKIADNKIELTIHQGRKHQVKRMLAAVNLPVKKLHRSQYGPLNLGDLKPGEWRELSYAEIGKLQ